MMKRKFENSDVLEHWLKGGDVQHLYLSGENWIDWVSEKIPPVSNDWGWRKKPKTKMVEYRKYLAKIDGEISICLISNNRKFMSAEEAEDCPGFIRWIDQDWI